MKIIDISQGSQEWLDLRNSKITATDCAPIMGVSEYQSARMRWLDKVNPQPKVENDAMRRGKELEPIARDYFSKKYKADFIAPVVLNEDRPWQMASLDGYDARQKMLLEIKCPGEAVFARAKAGVISPDYLYQCHHQLATVQEATFVVLAFFRFDVLGQIETHEVIVDYNQKTVDEITAKEADFYYNHLLAWKEPTAGRLDYVTREDADWLRVSERWREAKKRLDQADKEEAAARTELISLSEGASCRGFGVQTTTYPRRGAVDYDAIPELQGVDKDRYRKATSTQWRVTDTWKEK